jgi:predicted RND superfamily exporter protein
MAYEASKLEMFTSFNELLPYRHPFIAAHDKWSKPFGGANNLTIMFEVKHGTIFTQEVLRKVYTATQLVDVFPDVNHDQIDSIAHPHDALPARRTDRRNHGGAGHAPPAGDRHGRAASGNARPHL